MTKNKAFEPATASRNAFTSGGGGIPALHGREQGQRSYGACGVKGGPEEKVDKTGGVGS